MRNRMLFGLASAMSTASTVGCLSKYVAAAYDLTSMFVGVWWCVVQVIRHEENLHVRRHPTFDAVDIALANPNNILFLINFPGPSCFLHFGMKLSVMPRSWPGRTRCLRWQYGTL